MVEAFGEYRASDARGARHVQGVENDEHASSSDVAQRAADNDGQLTRPSRVTTIEMLR